MVKVWMERAEKSASWQYARNWLQYPWSMMPPPCRAIAFQRRRTESCFIMKHPLIKGKLR